MKVGDLVEWTVDGDVGVVIGTNEEFFKILWHAVCFESTGEWYRYDHPSIIKIN